MSSHHFVREFQEPAVYFHSFRREDMDQIGALLEWAPYVIAHESCLGVLQEAYVKVDTIISLLPEPSQATTFTDQSSKHVHLEEGGSLEGLLQGLLPQESVGLHIVDTIELLPAVFAGAWPAGFTLLYHATHRWMKVKASGYSKWWPMGTRLKVSLMDPEHSKIYQEQEILTTKDGQWEWHYAQGRVAYLGEPYF